MNKKLIRKMLTGAGGGFTSLITVPFLPNIKEIRHRLYNGINPSGYQHIPERIWDALNKKKANRSVYRDDQWATYLQIPEEERHSGVEKLQPARYRPSIGNTNGDVYRIPLNKEDADVLILRALLSGLGLGKNMVDRSLAHYLGDHTVGRGYDEKGEYISYYDKYDLNPFTGGTAIKTGVKEIDKWLKDNTSNIDMSMGIGKPFEIYDRIYLDDYYKVPKEARGATYLPEVTVIGKKKKEGKMNIIKLFKEGGQIRKMQTAAGGPIRWARKKENLEGIFNSLSKPSIQLRRQEQANRLNRSNSVGNYAYQVGKALGFKMSEDSANLATINSASKEALKDTRDYYNSLEYEQRLKDAGVPLYNRDSLLDKLQNISIYSLSDKSIPEFKTNSGGNFRAATAPKPFKGNVTGKRFGPGVYYNRSTMKDGNGENVYGTFIHEFSHWADPGLFPEAIEYNRSLTEGNLNSKASPYFRSDTEIRARAMDGIVTYEKNKDKYRDLDDFLDKEKDVKGLRELRNTFKDEKSFRNYMHHFVLNSTPKFDSNNVYYAKFGSKLLKSGSGIHIKKKNRGKFTSYCGGKVTDECILKGKHSSNPAIRKRATFAANVRKWKHKNGGLIWFAEDGAKASWWKKAGNWISDNSNTLLNIGSSLLNTFNNSSDNSSTKIQEASLEMLKAEEKNNNTLKAYEMALLILNNTLDPENPNAFGGVFAKVLPFKLKSMLDAGVDSNYNNQKALLKMNNQLLNNSGGSLSNLMLGLGETAINGLSLINNKNSSNESTNSNDLAPSVK